MNCRRGTGPNEIPDSFSPKYNGGRKEATDNLPVIELLKLQCVPPVLNRFKLPFSKYCRDAVTP
jgi:hypothetical protein